MPPPAINFTGDDARDLDWEETKGLVVSNAFVEGLDFKDAPGREERLVGEPKETLVIDESREGVKGVFASERARAREGVLGWLYMVKNTSKTGDHKRVSNIGHVIVHLLRPLVRSSSFRTLKTVAGSYSTKSYDNSTTIVSHALYQIIRKIIIFQGFSFVLSLQV